MNNKVIHFTFDRSKWNKSDVAKLTETEKSAMMTFIEKYNTGTAGTYKEWSKLIGISLENLILSVNGLSEKGFLIARPQ